ncbi:polysaccharide biosynthesis/export family protein [Pedobacter sp. BAL39]|uniref:polysaccharide biosynthesis/export family protein n=1 Tax=Pedobacter sp. BAL39 TaxID=391596 RepID=UPI0018DC13E6|nr:polysaccharide biosynthesis/export family protein [Pedobacter sp. BAL39]
MFIFLILSCCVSCGIQREGALFQTSTSVDYHLSSTTDNNDGEGYQIQSGDLLQIRNLQNPKYIIDAPGASVATAAVSLEELNYRVERDGNVTLPILGSTAVKGLTRIQAEKKIQELYSKEIKAPIIELKIINLKVTILGEVTKQGNYPLLTEHTTLIETLGAAGGLTGDANSKNLRIMRENQGKQQLMEVDLSNIKSASTSRILLQNNDVIYVSSNKQAERRKKTSSLSSILQPILLIMNTALIIYTISK